MSPFLHKQNSMCCCCILRKASLNTDMCPVPCAVFESRDKIVIVMEYASRGELYDYIQERRRLPETEARGIFRQITSAVHYCHKVSVHTHAHIL